MKSRVLDLFSIKAIAVILMLTDHLAIAFLGWGLINSEIYTIMRIAGRMSFPLFAFMLVNGWQKTKNKKRYFDNMALFALISQLPYIAMVYAVPDKAACGFIFYMIYWLAVPMAALVAAYAFFTNSNAAGTTVLGASLLLTLFVVRYEGFMLTMPYKLNIFYSLMCGMVCMECVQMLQNKDKYSLLFLAAALVTAVFVASRSDYDIRGLALILGLFFFKDNRTMQCAYIVVWGAVVYGVTLKSPYMALGTAMAGPVILMYNGEKGRGWKYFFYWFYPAHLFLIGAINAFVYFMK